MRMHVIVDGIIFELQARGGISRIYQEILPRMCSFEPELDITLLTAGRPKQPLPAHKHLTVHQLFPIASLLRPTRLWWRANHLARTLVLRRHLRRSVQHRAIWHSTYYTHLESWQGPKVATVVDMIPERWPKLFSGPMWDLFRRHKYRCLAEADTIISISEATRQDALDFYSNLKPERVRVIPLAHSPVFHAIRSRSAIPNAANGRPFLLYVGERALYKNFAGLLEAYSAWQRSREVDLVVVGRSWRRAEQRTMAQLGLTGRVHLMVGVDDMDLCSLYHEALAFVYPSLAEGFGIPLLEAMACGCPIVAADLPITVEVADDVPLRFEPGSKESLIGALEKAIAEGRASARTRAGVSRARLYDWDTTARKTLAAYSAL
jgi:glycosyltransferase involved in cell wall biosynthesis